MSESLVVIPYSELADPAADLSNALKEAFGPDSLGVLAVSGVPNHQQLRKDCLLLVPKLAALPREALECLEDATSLYNLGWSHGKEELIPGQAPDTNKGSFYYNPCCEDPAHGDKHLMSTYPEYFRQNKWPDHDLPSLRPAATALGQCIINTGLLLAQHCDRYISRAAPKDMASSVRVHDVLKSGRNHKARLLHYFPPSASQTQDQPQQSDQETDHTQSWCGWHTDHGSLTGLTRAVYLDVDGHEVACPDPAAGLYVRNRAGKIIKINIPENCLAFQVGEALQVHSGGLLMATPHYVRAALSPAAQGVARATLAVFMQPDVTCPLDAPPGVSEGSVAVGCWHRGDSFGRFARQTLEHYYQSQLRSVISN